VPAVPFSDACLIRFSAAPQLFTHFGPYVMPHQARPHLIICSPPAALLCSSSIPNSLPLLFISFHRYTAIFSSNSSQISHIQNDWRQIRWQGQRNQGQRSIVGFFPWVFSRLLLCALVWLLVLHRLSSFGCLVSTRLMSGPQVTSHSILIFDLF
jgi:hypothetical protein